MAEGKNEKNEFILSWLRDTEDAEKPSDDVPDEPIFKREEKPGVELQPLFFFKLEPKARGATEQNDLGSIPALA